MKQPTHDSSPEMNNEKLPDNAASADANQADNLEQGAEDALIALATPDLDPGPFYREYSRLTLMLSDYKVVAYQMSLATQRAIIRHQKQATHAHQPFWSRLSDTLPHLFNIRVETADVPFGNCRLVVEATGTDSVT